MTSGESVNDVNNFDSVMDSTDDLLPSLSVAETEMVLQDIKNLENRHQAFKSLVIPLSRQPSETKFTILEMKNRLSFLRAFT
jgi:hypothetical protein